MQPHFFSFESGELQKNEPETSSHCSSVQERLATYGSEALDTGEHLGLIVGSQKQADALLEHFGSLTVLARASVQELLPFVSRSKALGHPREIFKPVITHSAYSFILVHNHPSGDPSPSEADMRLTCRILEASRILQLHLVDHVIIGAPAPGRNSYFSFTEWGVIG